MPSASRRRGNTFVAAGSGRYGPYVVLTHRVRDVGTVKATAGGKGVTLGLKRRLGRAKCEAGWNFTTKSPYAKARRVRSRRTR